MALRGSLLEFELADIFQLIANDGKTGQLVLYEKDLEGFVIFFHGSIISAGTSDCNLQTILFKYIINHKRYSEQELNELLYLCQGEMRLFTQELVNKGYLSKDELSILARMSIEDLTCSLFFWENGRYRFDSLDKVDDYAAGGVKLSSDAVTMEAMRRIDEWKRINNTMSADTVFKRVRPIDPVQPGQTPSNPITDPAGYISSFVDGVASIADLCGLLFFTDYRIYETLFELWHANKIAPLKAPTPTRKIQPSSNAPAKSTIFFGPTIVSFVVAHCIVLILCGFGYFLHNGIFSKINLDRQWSKKVITEYYSERNLRIAALQFHSIVGAPPSGISQLINSGLIFSRDVSNNPPRVHTDLKKNPDSLEKK